MAIGYIAIPSHRVVPHFFALIVFCAKFAKNYFARGLLPRTAAHMERAREAEVGPEAVCMSCDHFHRQPALEDEFHAACVCPAYQRARLELSGALASGISLHSTSDLCKLLASGKVPGRMTAVGTLLIHVRQTRRKSKSKFEQLDERLRNHSAAIRRTARRLRRRPSCRHGVLFTQLPSNGCKCMADTSTEADWQNTRCMPALDADLKGIVAVPFDREAHTKLALLQAEARRLDW